MAQATRIRDKNKRGKAFSLLSLRLREALLIVALALAAYLLLSLLSYQATDPGWSTTGSSDTVMNRGGIVGAWLADVLLYVFGWSAYLFPAMLVVVVWLLFSWGSKPGADNGVYFWILRAIGVVMTLLAISSVMTISSINLYVEELANGAGGALGKVVGNRFADVFGASGSGLLLFAMLLAGVTLFLGLSWLTVIDWLGNIAIRFTHFWLRLIHKFNQNLTARSLRQQRDADLREQSKDALRDEIRITPIADDKFDSKRDQKERQVRLFKGDEQDRLPKLSLLDDPDNTKIGYSEDALKALSRQVELKLKDFRINVEVVEVQPGPVVTRFGLSLAAGTKVSRISSLAKDLARSLSVSSVRIVEVMPGKPLVGLEIPNEAREIVRLREILGHEVYENSTSLLMMAIGKDVSGRPVAVDLEKMPHLLAAGTTGSGKSVALNAMILSLLYKATPEQVRMIMIDPKIIELSIYNDIPHLLTPVVTDMKEAANALSWCVSEMERRYQLMAALGVRHIRGYNEAIKQALDSGEPMIDSSFNASNGEIAPTLTTLPFIVVIIDELADMMMVVGKQVEEMIVRLAQKARASGIHLIIATQRPSVDVITGLIKANIPTRMAFQVLSRVDSRTVLDQMGAEQLLGKGDMLYLPGAGLLERVHGAFVDVREVHRVVDYLKQHATPDYLDEIIEDPTTDSGDITANGNSDGGDQDAKYDEAVKIVTETRRPTISYVQRRLKIGYNRAARIIEEMEASGVISAPRANGDREVLAPPPVVD